MIWVIGGLFAIFILFFIALIAVERFKIREQNNPKIMERNEEVRKKWGPKTDFIITVFMWVFIIYVVYTQFQVGS